MARRTPRGRARRAGRARARRGARARPPSRGSSRSLPPSVRRERELVEAGRDRAAARLGQHLAPALGGDAAALDVRARELAPVVEELGVGVLERLELALDELVDVDEQLLHVFGDRGPVHGDDARPSPARVAARGADGRAVGSSNERRDGHRGDHRDQPDGERGRVAARHEQHRGELAADRAAQRARDVVDARRRAGLVLGDAHDDQRRQRRHREPGAEPVQRRRDVDLQRRGRGRT